MTAVEILNGVAGLLMAAMLGAWHRHRAPGRLKGLLGAICLLSLASGLIPQPWAQNLAGAMMVAALLALYWAAARHAGTHRRRGRR